VTGKLVWVEERGRMWSKERKKNESRMKDVRAYISEEKVRAVTPGTMRYTRSRRSNNTIHCLSGRQLTQGHSLFMTTKEGMVGVEKRRGRGPDSKEKGGLSCTCTRMTVNVLQSKIWCSYFLCTITAVMR
jgi:hypothetical protein